MTFGKRLYSIRKESELTQDNLADKLNNLYNTSINKSMISKWENDKSECILSTSKYLAQFFDVSLDYLIGVSDLRKPFRHDVIIESPKIIQFYNLLNDIGKREATKRVEELTYLSKYMSLDKIELFAAHTDDTSKENIAAMETEFDNFDDLQ